jgi:hypothetical protein
LHAKRWTLGAARRRLAPPASRFVRLPAIRCMWPAALDTQCGMPHAWVGSIGPPGRPPTDGMPGPAPWTMQSWRRLAPPTPRFVRLPAIRCLWPVALDTQCGMPHALAGLHRAPRDPPNKWHVRLSTLSLQVRKRFAPQLPSGSGFKPFTACSQQPRTHILSFPMLWLGSINPPESPPCNGMAD